MARRIKTIVFVRFRFREVVYSGRQAARINIDSGVSVRRRAFGNQVVRPFGWEVGSGCSLPAAKKLPPVRAVSEDILVASAADDYIPPWLGLTDDDLIDNPRLNPVLALTGADGYEEPGRLTFAAEYLPHLPVAPSLLLMGGYDAPRLTPFPNPGMPNLFSGNQFDNAAAPPLDSSSHAFNGQANVPTAPASINPAAPLAYPRPTPGLSPAMPIPQGPAQGGYAPQPQGGYGPPTGQYPGAGYANVPPPGAGAPPAGYAGPGPGFGAAPQYPMGHPDMLAYAGPDSVPAGGPTPPPPMAGYQGAPPQAAPYQMAGNPGAGYQQAGPSYPGQGYPQPVTHRWSPGWLRLWTKATRLPERRKASAAQRLR